MIKGMDSLRRFYMTPAYPVLVALLSVIGHISEWDIACIALILLTMIPAFLLCDDVRFAAMPILCIVFCVSAKDYKTYDTGYEERFLNPSVLILAAILACLVIGTLVWFLVRNRKTINRLPLRGLWIGNLIFCGTLLTNGLFSTQYQTKNLLFAVLISIAFLFVYFLFAFYVRFDRQTMDYLIFCFLLSALVIMLELVVAYFTKVKIEDGVVDKGSVVLGWGIWTAIGGMLAFLLPTFFYFAASHKHGWVAYWLGILDFLCIVLSQSRGALLFGILALAFCLGYLFFKGKNNRMNRIFTIILAGFGLCGVFLLRDKFALILQSFKDFGLSDNGRFDLWKTGWESFCKHPVFGVGFYDYVPENPAFEHGFDPYLFHNTVIQLLGTCGIIGFAAYAYHRAQTVLLAVRKPNTVKFFLCVALCAFLGFNLLDVLFFKFYPSFFYALMLLCIEKSGEVEEKQNK